MNLCFLTTITLLLLTPAIAAELQGNHEVAKPGCPDECGGVKIPFPFGIGAGCYLQNDTRFIIKCNNTNPILGFTSSSNHKILSINLSDHSIRLSSGVAYQCYSQGKPSSDTNRSSYNLDKVGFSLSATRNKFVAVGCDTMASVQNSRSQGHLGQLDLTGCMTSCLSLQSVSQQMTCSGRGCCEIAISDSMSRPRIQVGSFYNHTYVQDFNPCSFAFVGEVGSYRFSVANLTASAEDYGKIRVSVVYDWSVSLSYGGCSEANLCGPNTKCVSVDGEDGIRGYRCECLAGIVGNPYLSLGCQDIDECQDDNLNHCEKRTRCFDYGEGFNFSHCQKLRFCVNKVGGYDCQCPKGLVGKGTETSPCVDPPPATRVAKLVLSLTISIGMLISLIIFYGMHKVVKRSKEINKRKNNFKRNGGLLLQQKISSNEGVIDRTKTFGQIELVRATDNFNENRVLGRGGQGTVYKGMLVDGTIVAVKKSKKVDENQLAQFINEVVILSQINHRNVVKLFGCCLETEVPLLVYEFVPNGTLYQHIHNPSEDFRVTWKMRFQIAVDCAGALAYLHSSSSSPIYHRDVKSSNILLDEKYKAKISDFGTSKTISIDQTHVTTRVQGTFGYLDPEFFRSHQFNEKSDVYSFGVVLLELLTSKKPVFTDEESEDPKSLATEFLQLVDCPDRLYGFLDAEVLEQCSKEEVELLVRLVERCLSMNGKQRPTMKEVAMALEMAKSQHYQVPNAAVEQRFEWENKHVWTDQINLTNESTFCSSSSGSACPTNSSTGTCLN